MNPETVFLLERDADFALTIETTMKAKGIAVHLLTSGEALLDGLPQHAGTNSSLVVANIPVRERKRVLRVLIRRHPHLPAVMTIERPSVATAVDLMRRGAAYVLHKPFSPEQLLRTLEHVAASGADTHTDADTGNADDPIPARLASLSPRQKQILGQAFEGRINKVIAHRLGISIKTVELHRARMMEKMQASSAVDLIKMTTPYSTLLGEQVSG